MDAASAQLWITVAITVVTVVVLVVGRLPTDFVLLTALAILVLSGVLDAETALAGFANPALLSIAALLVVAAGLERSGVVRRLGDVMLSHVRGEGSARRRLGVPVALLSGLANNTPMVALLLPVARAWAGRNAVAPSRLLIPLSYAAILGGLTTLIGTSTNLVVAGMVVDAGYEALGVFSITPLGVPVAVVGLFTILAFARYLLPQRESDHAAFAAPEDFTGELEVVAGGPLDGAPLSAAIVPSTGHPLRPVELRRGDEAWPVPAAATQLHGGDRLVVAGSAARLIEYGACPGIAVSSKHEFVHGTTNRELLEVVILPSCALVGRRVGDGSFRAKFDAAVVAVARAGQRLERSGLGGWRLAAGDTLLIETRPGFANRYGTRHGLLVASEVSAPDGRRRSWLAAVIVAAMVCAAACGAVSLLTAALLAALAMVGFGYLRPREARAALDLPVLLTIGAALGLGRAVADSGLAALVAEGLLTLGGGSPWPTLIAVYLATVILTEVITNTAAAALVLPMALTAAATLGVSHLPFVFVVMIAASASFLTPWGYQTNLMVFGPGNYRVRDFLRAGLPVSTAVAVTACGLAPLIWPF
ncbi:MAG: SLC13 family permease [Planctomycetota bacterium]|jgi:di/tricarboxylate transporter